MDTPPRSAFLAGIVEPAERTAMMGYVYFAKSAASAVGPTITGVLAGRGLLWVSLVVAGALGCVYDVGVLALFWEREGVRRDVERGVEVRRDDTEEVIGRDKESAGVGGVVTGNNSSEETVVANEANDETKEKKDEALGTAAEREGEKPIIK